MNPLWSILIPTVPERSAKLAKCLASLDRQLKDFPSVSYRTLETPLWDRKVGTNSIGEKRNQLVSESKASFVSFVDDDDTLRNDYVSSIYEALTRTSPTGDDLDLVTFHVDVHLSKFVLPCVYDHRFAKEQNTNERYERRPNHIMVWRRDHAASYSAMGLFEDSDWANRMSVKGVDWRARSIDRVLYEYHHDVNDSVQTNSVGGIGARL